MEVRIKGSQDRKAGSARGGRVPPLPRYLPQGGGSICPHVLPAGFIGDVDGLPREETEEQREESGEPRLGGQRKRQTGKEKV